jgi:hypothetical protein
MADFPAPCDVSGQNTVTEEGDVSTPGCPRRIADGAETFFNSREFKIFKGIRILMRDEPFIVFDDVRTRVTRLMRAS